MIMMINLLLVDAVSGTNDNAVVDDDFHNLPVGR